VVINRDRAFMESLFSRGIRVIETWRKGVPLSRLTRLVRSNRARYFALFLGSLSSDDFGIGPTMSPEGRRRFV
jgi:hypothetical protein